MGKDKIVIDEKKFRKEQIQRKRSMDKNYIKKINILKIVLFGIQAACAIAIAVVVICLTHDKPYWGFSWWAGVLCFYMCHKSRKGIVKSIGEIKKLNNPFAFF